MLVSDATSVGSPKSMTIGKRKILDLEQQAESSLSSLKKARRVQNKGKCLRNK